MVTARPRQKRAVSRASHRNQVKYVSRSQGKKILDRQARKQLGMSGEAFIRKYRAGALGDYDHSAVAAVAMLIPLSE